MPAASRADFLKGPVRRYFEFTCPVSGLVARLQSLTERESAAIEMQAFERDEITGELRRDERGRLVRKESSIANSRALMIIAAVVDDEGSPIFSEGDIALVNEMDSGDTIPLNDAILEHCRRAEKKNPGRTEQPAAGDAPASNGGVVGGLGTEPGGSTVAGCDGSVGGV